MKKGYRRGSLRHNVSDHVKYGPIYWAEIDIFEGEAPTFVVKTIKRDSRVSEMDAARAVVKGADAWMSGNPEPQDC